MPTYNSRPNVKLQVFFMALGAGLMLLGWETFPDLKLILAAPAGFLIFALALGKLTAR